MYTPGYGMPKVSVPGLMVRPSSASGSAHKPSMFLFAMRPSVNKSERERALLRNHNRWRPSGGDLHSVGQGLLAAGGLSASLERFHRRKMNLGNAIELWLALRRLQHLGGDHLGLAGQVGDCHGDVLFLIDRFECLDVRMLWIRHHY